MNKIFKKFGQYGLQSHNPNNGIGLWPEEQELLLTLTQNCKNYLEIGSHNLGSALLVETQARVDKIDRNIVAVDLQFSPWAAINHKRAGSNVKMWECNSSSLKELHGPKMKDLDFVFIDGYHSFKQVVIDFNQVEEYLANDAIVAFHDTSPKLNNPDWITERTKVMQDNLVDLMNDDDENFYIDEAILHILERGYELIDCGISCYHPQETGLTGWIRGTTSPSSAIWAIKTCTK